MDLTSAHSRLASLLAAQAGHAHAAVLTPSELADLLTQRCGLTPADADALAWGQPSRLTADLSDRIAHELGVDAGLLRVLLGRMSSEVADETLLGASDRLPVQDCLECAALAADAQEASERGWDDADLYGLVVDTMAHASATR